MTEVQERKTQIFFFFLESFNLWCPLLIIILYHQTKTPISFCCRQELNLKILIQPSETLLVDLIETYTNPTSYSKMMSQIAPDQNCSG